jgi:streptogramin lyase
VDFRTYMERFKAAPPSGPTRHPSFNRAACPAAHATASRRSFLAALAAGGPLLTLLSGCDEQRGSSGRLVAVWGRGGVSDGRFNKPRAMTIDADDLLYIVDITARIQVFTTDGEFVRGWQTPVHANGRPTGLSIDHRGNLLVADTHYFRVLTYSPLGELLETLGGTLGHGPGEFGFVTDAVEDSRHNLYVSEYGEYDRIQKFSPAREYLLEWGGHGQDDGQFSRPQSLAVDADDRIWVADACNHRIQVFDPMGRVVSLWGEQGSEPGQLSYPYGMLLDGQGHVYVTEFGNHRVQKFTLDGRSLGCWATHGRAPGEVLNPWALARDSRGRIYVLDTGNNRVQCIEL